MSVKENKNELTSKLFSYSKQIKDFELRDMVDSILLEYIDRIKSLPASISGKYHSSETMENHLERTFSFTQHFAREFNLNKDDTDILYASALLHDIANAEFISEKRNPNEFQKLYQEKFNRSMESSEYHPVLGMFIIGKYVLEKHIINPLIFKTAMAISSHMSHWYQNCPQPRTDVEKYLAMSDYLASRKEINIVA